MSSTTLVNSVPIEVTHLDGTKSTVVLRVLSIRLRFQYLHLLAATDIPAIVALCADKSPEWIDTLTDASFKGLSKKAFELNFLKAVDLVEGDPAMAAKIAPVFLAMLAMEHQVGALPVEVRTRMAEITKQNVLASAASSPAPATSASVAAIGNE